ncbi:MAG TPA: ComEA family DNA-binding protein [Ktedonobacteraceae bacterium]|nr:ComEA family DNA-binding protein [Ktedonobacteraceae bacterium]
MQQRSQFSQFHKTTSSPLSLPVYQQETQPLPVVPPDGTPAPFAEENPSPLLPLKPSSKKLFARVVAGGITLILAGSIYIIWFVTPSASSASPPASISQQSFNASGQNSGTATATGGALHIYVTGSVKHPGVYTLPAGARVYQLLQAAGGALPQADLVSLNLAAPLTDGQEVYVLAVGESPPTYQGGVPGPNSNATVTTGQAGQIININSASIDEMRQALHVSSATAQKIIDYRTQHGPFTSIDQLLQVVSRSIYDKIKNSVTV